MIDSAPLTHTRRRREHAPAGHAHRVAHLVAGGLEDLPEIEALLATLPMCATGRVFIEVERPELVSVLSAPARMVVTWLVRSERGGEMGSARACAPGQALSRAVRGWASEMLCAETAETPAEVEAAAATRAAVGGPRVWLSGPFEAVAESFDFLVDELGVDPGIVSTPARFGPGLRRGA